MDDFLRALNETKPQFGVDENTFEWDLLGGFIEYSEEFKSLYNELLSEFERLKDSESSQLHSILIEGE